MVTLQLSRRAEWLCAGQSEDLVCCSAWDCSFETIFAENFAQLFLRLLCLSRRRTGRRFLSPGKLAPLLSHSRQRLCRLPRNQQRPRLEALRQLSRSLQQD